MKGKLTNEHYCIMGIRPEMQISAFEAESVAYTVCQHYGLDTSDYSFGYVAGWSRGRELTELKASLDVIHSTVGEIINTIQPPPELERKTQEQLPQHRKSKKSMRK